MAIDYRTAAALSQNIAGIGDMFMQMNDPANRAKAALVGNQNALLASQVEGQGIENRYRPGLFLAQTGAANGSAASGFANARQSAAQAANWNIRTRAGEAALDGYTQVPTTSYSTGAAVGGPDEMQDRWTNKGYTATGKNLSEGVVAANPKVYPLGTVLRDPSGKTFIVGDVHGNQNPNVVDFYRSPENYQAQSGPQQLQVVGQEKIPYGTTAAQLAEMRAKYERQAGLSNIFAGGGAADLATGTAKMAALNAPDEISARRALAAQGVAMNQGEYFEPGLSTAFQGRDLQNNLDQERLEQGGAMDRTVADNIQKNQGLIFNAATEGIGQRSTGTGGKFDSFDGAKEIGGAAAARFSLDGETIGQTDLPKAQAWAASVSTLTGMNVPFEVAKSYADAHHGLPTTEDGMFSSPRQTYNSFNATSITPEQAAQLAEKYSGGSAGGGDMERIMQAAQIFGYGAQEQPPAAPAPVQTVGAPPAAAPQTGVEKSAPKASDEFKRRQSSDEAKAEKSKSANIQKLEGRIKELTGMLKSGKEESNIVSGAYGYSSQARKGSSALSNDNYNARLAELQKLEGELAALKSPAQTASQGGVRRYNPATGTIE